MREKETLESQRFEKEEREDGYIVMKLKENGEILGTVNLDLFTRPFYFYYVDWVGVKGEKGKGIGSRLVDEMNRHLRETEMPGIAFNTIAKSSPARGMYERHGWNPIEGHEGYISYNLPSGLDRLLLLEAVGNIEAIGSGEASKEDFLV